MSGRGASKLKMDAKQPLITEFCIADYPHVRSAKMRCWKQTAPISGYTRWRAMQAMLNRKMHTILSPTELAELSVLRTTGMNELRKRLKPYASMPRAGGAAQGKSKSSKKRELNIGEISNLDGNPDADVKFFLNGTFRVSRSSLLRPFTGSDLRERKARENSILQGYLGGGFASDDEDDDAPNVSASAATRKRRGAAASPPYPFRAHSGATIEDHPLMRGAPKVVLVGTDLHIAIAILWPPGTFDGPGATTGPNGKEGSKHLTVEFFDSRGVDQCIMVPNIASFFFSVMGETFADPQRLVGYANAIVAKEESGTSCAARAKAASAKTSKMKLSAKMKLAVVSKCQGLSGNDTEDEGARAIMSMMAVHKTKKKRANGERAKRAASAAASAATASSAAASGSSEGGRPLVERAAAAAAADAAAAAAGNGADAARGGSSALPVDIWSAEGHVRFVSFNNDDWQEDEQRKIDQHQHLCAASIHQIQRTLKARASGGWSDQRLRAKLDECTAAPRLEELDVFCQTWIYFYVYMRLREAGVDYGIEGDAACAASASAAPFVAPPAIDGVKREGRVGGDAGGAASNAPLGRVGALMRHIRSLRPTQRLDQIKRFQTWVYDWQPHATDAFIMTQSSKPRKVYARKKKAKAKAKGKAVKAGGSVARKTAASAAGAMSTVGSGTVTPSKRSMRAAARSSSPKRKPVISSAKRKLPVKAARGGAALGRASGTLSFRVKKKRRTKL